VKEWLNASSVKFTNLYVANENRFEVHVGMAIGTGRRVRMNGGAVSSGSGLDRVTQESSDGFPSLGFLTQCLWKSRSPIDETCRAAPTNRDLPFLPLRQPNRAECELAVRPQINTGCVTIGHGVIGRVMRTSLLYGFGRIQKPVELVLPIGPGISLRFVTEFW